MSKQALILIILGLVLIAVAGTFLWWQMNRVPVQPLPGGGIVIPPPIPDVTKNIVVTLPKPGDSVNLPIVVKGQARVFENTVLFRLRDAITKTVLYEGFDTANALDIGQFGDFNKQIDYLINPPTSSNVILDVYWQSPKDGSDADMISLPLTLDLTNLTTLDIYFSSGKLNPGLVDCGKVFAVTRTTSQSQVPAEKALEMLIEGPTISEVLDGYATNIRPYVKVQSLVISNRVATVDFNDQLDFQVGGSCAVTAIRAQIEQTLKQFPTVKDVIISINGRTDDILQP